MSGKMCEWNGGGGGGKYSSKMKELYLTEYKIFKIFSIFYKLNFL